MQPTRPSRTAARGRAPSPGESLCRLQRRSQPRPVEQDEATARMASSQRPSLPAPPRPTPPMVPAPDGRVSGARTAGLRAARLHGGAALLVAPRLTAVAPSLWRASGGVLGAGGSATTTRHWCALAPPRPAAILPLLGQRAPSARRGNLSLTDFSAVGKASSWSPRDPRWKGDGGTSLLVA